LWKYWLSAAVIALPDGEQLNWWRTERNRAVSFAAAFAVASAWVAATLTVTAAPAGRSSPAAGSELITMAASSGNSVNYTPSPPTTS
jgi:hypothetical protein